MPDLLPPMRVSWNIRRLADGDVAELEMIDALTQERLRFRVPLHAIPTLRDLLDHVIGNHPDDFPNESTLFEYLEPPRRN